MAQVVDFQITDNTSKAAHLLESQIKKLLVEWGLAAEGFAKRHITRVVYDTPPSKSYKRTGRLRASLTFATQTKHSQAGGEAKSGDGLSENDCPDDRSVVVGTNVEYAQYVEFGSSKMKARPYLRPAIEEHKEEFQTILESYLTDADV